MMLSSHDASPDLLLRAVDSLFFAFFNRSTRPDTVTMIPVIFHHAARANLSNALTSLNSKLIQLEAKIISLPSIYVPASKALCTYSNFIAQLVLSINHRFCYVSPCCISSFFTETSTAVPFKLSTGSSSSSPLSCTVFPSAAPNLQ